MPIFIDPTIEPPPPPETVTSPDGVLTVYQLGDGALLVAKYDVLPARRNFAPDPSFIDFSKIGVTGGASLIKDSSWSMNNTTSMKIVAAANNGSAANVAPSNRMTLEAGETYTASVYCHLDKANNTAGESPRARSLNAIRSLPGQPTDYDFAIAQAPNAAGDTRLSITFTVPDDGSTVGIRVVNGSATTGDAVYFDWMVVEQGTEVGDYFSGDSVDDDDYTYRWVSSPFNSPSIAMPRNTVERIRFTRRPDQPVRSGNDAWAVGGVAIAYDMEAPLGRTSTWRATPVRDDGTLGTPSEGAALTMTKPTEPYNSWLKSVQQPWLSMRVFCTTESLPSWSYASRQTLSQVQGSEYPAGGWDKHMAAEVTISAYTDPDVDQQQMLQLLTSGPLLFQTDPDFGEADFYALPGDVTRDLASTMANGARTWQIPLTVIARPTPYGAPLWIPGRTLAETQQGTIALRQQVYPLVGDPLGIPTVTTEAEG